jgi:hypothetical protein
MFLVHTVLIAGFVLGLAGLYTWMGLVRVGMLLWQGAIWLVNAAMLANPVLLIVVGIIALVAIVVAAIVYWDQWTAALMNTAAFKWIAGQLQALTEWFGSIGGWTGMASAAWDGIVAIFKDAINGLIEMLNKIPGVQIDAAFGEMPKAPEIPGIQAPVPTTPSIDRALQAAPMPLAARPALSVVPPLVMAPASTEQAEQARQRMNGGTSGGLSPTGPTAVPQGGLLRSIQNNNSQTQNKGTHVETININTAKPMTPLEVENMMSMAVGG